jgi:hypothetical protein
MSINPVADINAQLANMMAILGSDGTYTVAKTGLSSSVRGLINQMAGSDTALIQSYGVNGTTLTFQASAFASRPVKFDNWVCNGRKYVFDVVIDEVVNGGQVAYKVIAKGDVA